MPTFNEYSVPQTTDLRRVIAARLEGCDTLCEASDRTLSAIVDEFRESLVLARAFATVDYQDLPVADRRFVDRLAEERQVQEQITPSTRVVTLLGTRGIRDEWNRRENSRHHRAIPLVSASFVRTIPVVSRLMTDAAQGIGWLETLEANIVLRSLGRMARLVFVEDAVVTKTPTGHEIITSREFVEGHDVRTVFGLGGIYLDGTFLALIFFTRETIDPDNVLKFLPLMNTFKTATVDQVMAGRIF